MAIKTEKILFKWADYQNNIVSCLEELQKDSDFSDVTLVCEEAHQIEAHRIILSACSPFFRSILKKNKHPHPMIYMRGLKARDLVAVVDYIYHGEASIYQEDLDGFLDLADELQLNGLDSSNTKEALKEGTPTIKELPTVSENISDEPLSYNSEDSIQYINIQNLNESSKVQYEGILSADTNAVDPKSKIDFMVERCNDKEEPIKKVKASKPKREKVPQQNTISKGNTIEMDLKRFENTTIIRKNATEIRLPLETKREELKKKIDSMIELVNHQKFKFRCIVCGKVTAQKGDINRHVETHIKGLSYPCKICGKVKESKNALNGHMSFHKGLSYPCKVCGKVKKSKFALTSHMSCHNKKVCNVIQKV